MELFLISSWKFWLQWREFWSISAYIGDWKLYDASCIVLYLLWWITCYRYCWLPCNLNFHQIGSRITSKRISQMLEECFPLSYIMVDKHPCRHDPLHIVTHRIQNTIAEFSDCLFKTQFPPPSGKWSCFLHALNAMVCYSPQ